VNAKGDNMSHSVNDEVKEQIYEYLHQELGREPTLKELQEEFEKRSR
tara:strand:+ start:999 stop:1139 length:141 start_codon:yes stop_codon:yes gene_type:complete